MTATSTIAAPFHTTRWGSHESPLIHTLIIGPDNARCHNTQTIARGRLKNQRITRDLLSSWGEGEGGFALERERKRERHNSNSPVIQFDRIKYLYIYPTRTSRSEENKTGAFYMHNSTRFKESRKLMVDSNKCNKPK